MPNEVRTDFIVSEGDSPRKIHNFRESLTELNRNINDLGKNSAPLGKNIGFDGLEDKAKKLSKTFQDLGGARLDGGNVNHLTREIVKARDGALKLSRDVTDIKMELSTATDRNIIKVLTQDLKAADAQAESLDSRLNNLNRKDGSSKAGSSRGTGGARRGRITDLQATALELADDFAPEGFNRPFNAAARGMFAVNAISLTTAATFGAIAAAGYGIVKVTENIRTEAERRLKVEELIQGAINRQIISQREGLQNTEKLLNDAQKAREFQRYLADSAIDELTRKKTAIRQVQALTPNTLPVAENGKLFDKPNEVFQKQTQDLLLIDARIDALRQEKQRTVEDAFSQRFESYKKSADDSARFEEEMAKKRAAAAKKAAGETEALNKQIGSTLNSLYQKQNQSNPLAQVIFEANRAMNDLRETTKKWDKDLQQVVFNLQKNINANALFAARLDNNLNALALREDADSFRNPRESDEDRRRHQDETINNYLRADRKFGIGGENAGNRLMKLFGAKSFEDLNNSQRQDLFEYATLFNVSAQGMKPEDFVRYLAQTRRQNLNPDDNLNLRERLDRQFKVINSLNPQTEEQRATADRKIIALTQGLNPNDLNPRQRDLAAASREREAERSEKNENKIINELQELRGLMSRYVSAATIGSGIKLEPGSRAGATVNVSAKDFDVQGDANPPVPTPEDTADAYGSNGMGNFNYGGKRGLSNY